MMLATDCEALCALLMSMVRSDNALAQSACIVIYDVYCYSVLYHVIVYHVMKYYVV